MFLGVLMRDFSLPTGKKNYLKLDHAVLMIALLCIPILISGCRCSRHRDSPAQSGSREMASGRNKPDVILIVIDTLRADHISAYGYPRKTTPFMDSFSKENIHYSNAIAPGPWTAPSVASLFTSLFPSAHGVFRHAGENQKSVKASVLAPSLKTLTEAVKDAGYRTYCVNANPWVVDYLGFAQGFDKFLMFENERAEKINNEAYKILKTAGKGKDPVFLYLHYMDPHRPYRPLPEHDIFKGEVEGYRYNKNRWKKINRYDGEIHYIDSKLQEMMSFLKKRKLYKDAIIIITADHGEKFGEHGDRVAAHGWNYHEEDIHVPLFIKAGGINRKDERVVSLVDIYPTILEQIRVEFDSSRIHGADILSGQEKIKRPGVISEGNKGKARKAIVSNNNYKMIIHFDAKGDKRVSPDLEEKTELFHRLRDPREKKNILKEPHNKRMKKRFYKVYRKSLKLGKQYKKKKVNLKKDTVEKLKSIGYLN